MRTGQPPARVSWPWQSLPHPPTPLLFLTSGRGEVTAALSMVFTPARLLDSSVYRGIAVEKVIRAYDSSLGGPSGPPLASIPLGSIVSITIQITTADDLQNLVVDEWLPSGLEALDHDSSKLAGRRGGLLPSLGCFLWWRCTRFQRETRKDRLTFYAAWAHAGTHTLSYVAIAATRGSFGLPPAKASAMLEPEVMGLSQGGSIRVDSADATAATRLTDGEAAGTPIAQSVCPGDCSGRGSCNTRTGVCACSQGASGEDCSDLVAMPSITALNANDTLICEASRTTVAHLHLRLHRRKPSLDDERGVSSAATSAGTRPASSPMYTYAISTDEAILTAAALSVTAISAEELALSVAAPSSVALGESRCVQVKRWE